MDGGLIIVPRPRDEIAGELLHSLKEIIRYAIMTLAALKDPDARFLGWSRLPANVIHDVKEAYGYSSASVRRFSPSPRDIEQMEIVLPWLAWLRREEGDMAARRILGWAMGAALWRLGQREKCSDRTILNRIDRSVANIIRRFVGTSIEVEKVDEPYKGVTYALVYEPLPGPHGGEVKIQKVYVGGLGYVRGGKKLRDGSERFDVHKLTA